MLRNQFCILPVRSQFFELKSSVKFSFITFFINIEHVHGIKSKKREGECETAAALTILKCVAIKKALYVCCYVGSQVILWIYLKARGALQCYLKIITNPQCIEILGGNFSLFFYYYEHILQFIYNFTLCQSHAHRSDITDSNFLAVNHMQMTRTWNFQYWDCNHNSFEWILVMFGGRVVSKIFLRVTRWKIY